MQTNKRFLLQIILIFWLLFMDKVQSNDSCWNNESICNIKTELFKNLDLSNGISMQIDCSSNSNDKNSQDDLRNVENDFPTTPKKMFLQRFKGVQYLMLDGCQTPLNAHTFGLELLPICANITRAFVKHFHMDTLKPLGCNESPRGLQLEYVNIQFNEIAVIDENSFPRNYFLLKDIVIEKNRLKVIHRDAFKAITSLENLYIVNEPTLMLKFPDLFEYSSASNIHLETLKQMTSAIFHHLPETLQNLYVAKTQFDNDAVFVNNSLVLQNLTIQNCALRIFILRDVHSTVKRIDLSGNVMKTFTAYENDLKELNLSNNKLGWLQFKWLQNLTSLERLILKGNYIQTLSLHNLLKGVPNGQSFDISGNLLPYLQDYEKEIEDARLYQVRLKCDRNPWDCLWLHEFAHYHPEKFRILQYEKFISKINVNGLECIPAEKPIVPVKDQKISPTAAMEQMLNVSAYTLLYGSPWEFKRNQRAEALIIVFMLPLGIAFLFVLLYMWIYCQKMFHLSYYQSFPCMRRSPHHSAQRFDIIRQLPPRSNQTEPRRPLTRITDENEEGYEIPINGIIPECNCVIRNDGGSEIVPCQKPIHITYEHLPMTEEHHRQQIYEEIVQVGDYDGRTESLSVIGTAENCNSKQNYDRLTFK